MGICYCYAYVRLFFDGNNIPGMVEHANLHEEFHHNHHHDAPITYQAQPTGMFLY